MAVISETDTVKTAPNIASEEAEDRGSDSVKITTADGQTTITIHKHLCKGCEICVEVCPKDVLEMVVATDRWEGTIVEVINMNACNACMLCDHQCPDFAIEVFNIKKEQKREKRQNEQS